MSSFGFIGGGRVTRILLGGWARASALPPRILVNEPEDAAFQQLLALAPEATRASLAEAGSADLVFLALHPPKIPEVLAALRTVLAPRATLVSLAPKFSIAQLAAGTGAARIVRIIPNAPSIIGRGYNPATFGPGVDGSGREDLSRLFGRLGALPEVEEAQLEAYAILTAMGPTYFWFQWQALREVMEQAGLAGAERDRALAAMVNGAVTLLLEGGLSPAAVMDLVPVKPLAAMEPQVSAAYREALPALHAKIRPALEPQTV